MNCKYCGQLIEESVKFCPHCGKSTAEEAPKAENTHTYESIPAPEVTPVPPAVHNVEQKSRTVAGLMGILFGVFLGGLGIHNFYLGYTKKAVAQLLAENKASVKVLHSADRWFGVTYAADKPKVVAALRELTDTGKYPDGLWK